MDIIRALMIDDDLSFAELFSEALKLPADNNNLRFDITANEDLRDDTIFDYDMYFIDNLIHGIHKCIEICAAINKQNKNPVIFIVSCCGDRDLLKNLINKVRVNGFIDKPDKKHSIGALTKKNLDVDGIIECAKDIVSIKRKILRLSKRLDNFNFNNHNRY